MNDLQEWLAETSSMRFIWGEWDCMLEVFDWVKACSGLDLGVTWRGRYSDADDCRAMLKPSGGLVTTMRHAFALNGFSETAEPAAGDVGLVRVPWQHKSRAIHVPAGAIMLPSGRWRACTEGGHVFSRFPLISAWKVL